MLRAALAAGLLGTSACGTNRRATMLTPTSTQPNLPSDPSLPYWQRGNYVAVDSEIDALDLPITGSIPPELEGLYVRNGSNSIQPTAHWFLGDGMVHGVRLSGGRAEWYRNRWVQTPLLGKGNILDGNVGAPGGPNNSSNTSVVAFADRLVSLQEVGFPFELRPDDLSTIGPVDFHGTLTWAFTAHPKIDPVTGLVHAFGYGFAPPYLTYFIVDPLSWRVVYSQEVPTPGPTMIHDFAITESDVVFWDLPVVFDVERAISGDMPFSWDPTYGARVGVLPLAGGAARWTDIPLCYVFHGTNAWRDGDDVVVDVSVQRTMFKEGGDEGSAGLQRWRVGTGRSALTFTQDVIIDRNIDLPTIDRSRTGRAHRYGYYVVTREDGDDVEFGGVVRVDALTGRSVEWDPGLEQAGGEPLFVPRSDGLSEDDGWVLVFVFDKTRGSSDLVILDAGDVSAGPVARVHLPRRVPFGFHGWWLGAV